MPRKKKEVVEPTVEPTVVEEVKPAIDKPKKPKKQAPKKPVEKKPVEEFKTEVQAEFVPEPKPQKVNKFKVGDFVRCKTHMEIRYVVHSFKIHKNYSDYPIIYKCLNEDNMAMTLICEEMLVLD